MHSNTIIKSLFLKSESSFVGLAGVIGALHSVRSQEQLDSVARRLVAVARDARILREPELRERACELVLALDVSPKLHVVAKWYQGLGEPGRVRDHDANRKIIARAADNCGNEYLPQILLVTGRSYHSEDKHGEALSYYIEVGKAAGYDILSATQALWNVAVLDSERGDSRGALRRFEGLFTVVKALSHRYPTLYANYLNNLAALLAENGRTLESRCAINVALASPFAPRFPEWRETQKEIEQAATPGSKARSSATVTVAPPLPKRKQAPNRLSKKPPRTVFAGIIGLIRTGTVARLRSSNPHVVSLIERYVKTVRIRDSP
jgi:tetratricopeptide (TPR) repeat protein